MLRRVVSYLIVSFIVLFWLVMTGLLLYRELGVPKLGPSTSARRRTGPSESWMGVYLPSGRRVGYLYVRESPEVRDNRQGSTTVVRAKIRMTLLSRPTDILVSGRTWRPYEGKRADFDFQIRSSGHEFRIEGSASDGTLAARVHTAGETVPLRLAVDDDMLLWSDMGAGYNLTALEVGQEFLVDIFDPMTMSRGQARIKCLKEDAIDIGGEQLPTKVVSVTSGGMVSTIWVTETDEVVRAETPFGLVLQKLTAEEALSTLMTDTTDDLLAIAAIRPTGKGVSRGARRMIVRLDGVEAAAQVLTDDTQSATGPDTFTIVAASVPVAQGEPSSEPENVRLYLAGDAFVQANHPRVRQTAEEIVGDATAPWTRARLIHDWVYETIEKKPVVSIPSALEVLDTREGDCNEHTVLYAALARAAGIPTRIAIGLVWSDDYRGFYYHAWPEVYIDRWIWTDPTLGQPVADATHIKLLTGGIEKWPQLLPFLGQLKIEVMDIE